VQVLEPSGATIAVNRAWEALWGVTLAAMADYNVLADPQLEATGVAPLLRRAFAGERVEIPPIGYVPDRGAFQGTPRWVRAVAAPVRNDSGDVVQVILVHEDVTQTVTASEQLVRMRDLLEESQRSAQVGTWEWDISAGTLTWTDELYRIYGQVPGTPLDYGYFLLQVHEDDRPRVQEAVERALSDGEPFAFDHRVVRPDGTTRWLHARGRVLLGEAGAPVRMIGSGQDITDRVEATVARERMLAAQQALADAGRAFVEAEADLPGLLDVVARSASVAVGDGCSIWLLEDGGRLQPVASHHPDPAVLAATRAYFAQVDHESTAGLVGQVARTGQSIFLPVLDPTVMRDRVHPAYRGLLDQFPAYGLLAVPLQARSRVLGVIAASRTKPNRPYDAEDLTLLREFADRAAFALDNARLARDAQAAERRYRGLFEGVADAILVADDERNLRDVNAAAVALLGYSRAELLALRIEDIVADESPGTVAEFAQFGHEGEWYGELALRRNDGATIPVEVRATIVSLPEATVNIAALRDMSERQALQRQQQEFLEAVSHDLMNPLAVVRLQVQSLTRSSRIRAIDQERLLQGLEAIGNASERIQAQLEELQDAVRLRAGHPLELRAEPVDLVVLAREAVATAQATTYHHIAIDASPAEIMGIWDPRWLRRVLDNLLSNAIKYSPGGGHIALNLATEERDDGQWAVLEVRDTGVGIPAADLPYIFDRYRRGSNVRTHIHGAGIGLAGVRQIVEQHGGAASAESDEGRGSTLTVRLPLSREASPRT
jgi:PAS domain S-box-containing protein